MFLSNLALVVHRLKCGIGVAVGNRDLLNARIFFIFLAQVVYSSWNPLQIIWLLLQGGLTLLIH